MQTTLQLILSVTTIALISIMVIRAILPLRNQEQQTPYSLPLMLSYGMGLPVLLASPITLFLDAINIVSLREAYMSIGKPFTTISLITFACICVFYILDKRAKNASNK